MTYGDLKKRIYTLLDIDIREENTVGSSASLIKDALVQTVNDVARKTAFALKAIYKTADLYFERDDVGVSALLPSDVALVREICRGTRRYGAVSFERAGNTLYFFGAKEGFYTVGYYAFPRPLGVSLPDTASLTEMSDAVWETVAYGVCAALCMKVYPTDMKRYMRLATDFDERITAYAPTAPVSAVRDTVFSSK